MAPDLQLALQRIDEAHAEDPNKIIIEGHEIPYELHYAQKCSSYLSKRTSSPSPLLTIAVRAQHFRRWEIPRDSYPMTKIGYHSWRTYLKKRQGELTARIVSDCGFSEQEAARVKALIMKDGLNMKEEEVQVLEDVACLVFLDDQFEEFKEKHDDDKIVRILQKTWGKMSQKGQEMALEMQMENDCRRLVEKALSG